MKFNSRLFWKLIGLFAALDLCLLVTACTTAWTTEASNIITLLVPAIEAARARFPELVAVRAEADSLSEALVARKSIERAKGLLMEREKLSEADAFARLRKASQVSGRPLRVIADAVISTFEAS